jgi:Acetyltransferase (GNAT) domain
LETGRRIIRQIERKLDELGEWEVEYFDDISDRPDLFGKILYVEKRSWKGQTPKVLIVTAEEILNALSGSQIVPKSKPEFKCGAWFLQINGKAVAYTYVIKYRGRALIHKTAYDDTYRKSNVGKYIMNIAIRDMFNEGQVKTINFMGDFAFMEFWTSLSSNYVKVFLRKGNVAPLVKSLKVFNIVLDKLPDDKKPRFLKTLF